MIGKEKKIIFLGTIFVCLSTKCSNFLFYLMNYFCTDVSWNNIQYFYIWNNISSNFRLYGSNGFYRIINVKPPKVKIVLRTSATLYCGIIVDTIGNVSAN